jgi:hypothetical protein
MLDRFHRAAATRQTYVALLIAALAFFFIGNLGGKNGNPSWILAPVCLLLAIVSGIDALIQSRHRRSSQVTPAVSRQQEGVKDGKDV